MGSNLHTVTVTVERFDSVLGERHTIIAEFNEDGSYVQSGAPKSILGDNVDLLSKIGTAVADEWADNDNNSDQDAVEHNRPKRKRPYTETPTIRKGMRAVFRSSLPDGHPHNGEYAKVLRSLTDEELTAIALQGPIFLVSFANGDEGRAFPDELTVVGGSQ